MKFISSLLLVCFLTSANAATYYFSSNSGDDSRSSTEARNSSTPWKSLSKLNSFFSSLQPGDQVLLKRGETFYGSIIVNKSGTSGSPIFIGAYGSGNKPVITSLVTLSGWSSKGSGIWESSNSSLGSNINMVLLNGAEQELGRYPNSNSSNKGYLIYESHSGKSSITDNQLSSSTNWTGAEVVMRPRRWILDRNLVTSYSGHKISYKATSSYAPYDKYGYFFQNSIKTLDKLGEWYFNSSSKKLSVYFGSNSPSSNSVQAATKDNLFFAERYSNIALDNLNFKGSNGANIHIKYGSNISIENCDIQFSGATGVEALFHENFKIENSTISNSNKSGIDLGYQGDHAVIRNNVVTNTAMIAGLGASGDNVGIGILSCGNFNIIEYNQFKNTGYTGIWFTGNDVTVKNNLVDGFCINKDDGAGIYTTIGHTARCYRRKVTGNIILNGVGAPAGTVEPNYSAAEGFYADNNASDVEVKDNTMANCVNQGIYVHSSYALSILNNTLFNNNRQLSLIEDNNNSKVRSCTVNNNIVFSKTNSQKVVFLSSPYNDISSFGKFSNNYYARPSDSKNNTYLATIHKVESGAKLLTYTQAVRFEYNAGKTTKTVGLDGSYVNVKGNKYSGSVKLEPFTSVVLIKTSGGSSNSSPSVSITSPEQGASYSSGASVNISADASDDDGSIKKVEFYNGSKLLGTTTGSPYTWNWNNVSAGDYTITAKATDNSGNTSTSDGVSISVSSSSSSSNPIVSLTSPTQNASYLSGATINISADATDGDGSIKKVEFYNGSKLLNTQTGSPYTWNWSNVSSGNYTITAKATDNSGNVTTSAGVSISVGSSSSSNPTVSLTSPTQNASYNSGSNITITANASDPGGSIKKVEFYNGSKLLNTQTGSPYTWNWKNVSTGNYTITAKATDNSGNTTTSAGVSISVGSSSSSNPTVSLTSPNQNASYNTGATINISAKASDADGSIKTLQFYNGSTLLHTEHGTPYSWDWKNVKAGNYTITAKATDNDGHVATSSEVNIKVGGSNNISSRPSARNADTANNKKIVANTDNKSFDFQLFPNPSINTIKVNFDHFPTNQKANLSIQSMSGSIIKSIPVILSGKTIDIDISSLAPGLYIIRVGGDNFGINKKFIKVN